jgi:hypothetical protein
MNAARILARAALAGVLISATAANAGETPLDCSKAALRRARAAAGQAARHKDYKAAIAALAPLARACDDGDPVELGWVVSDLAVDYLKDGRLLECKQLVDEVLYPKSAIARSGNDKLTNALAHNGELCQKALVTQYGPFSSAPCPFAIDGAATHDSGNAAAVALPAELWPKEATAACLAVVDGRTASGQVVCPRVAVVARQKDGKLTRHALRTAGGGLGDTTFCCGYDTVAIGTRDGKPMVRIGASTVVRECSGGSAHSTLDEVLAWKGDVLTLVVDASGMVE